MLTMFYIAKTTVPSPLGEKGGKKNRFCPGWRWAEKLQRWQRNVEFK